MHQVLLVDDEISIGPLYEAMLRECDNLWVCHVKTTCEAQAHMAQTTPAVAVIDMHLPPPSMQGWQLIEKMKASPVLAKVPVIAVSAGQDDCLQKAMELGAVRVFHKPFSVLEMRRAILNCLPDSATSAV